MLFEIYRAKCDFLILVKSILFENQTNLIFNTSVEVICDYFLHSEITCDYFLHCICHVYHTWVWIYHLWIYVYRMICI